jgi:16S rRNA (cytosine967-C5)-methyltransferase
MTRNARFVAIETLKRHQQSRQPLSRILDSLASKYGLVRADRHLSMKISYGVMRQREHLDRLLQELCVRPLNQMQPFVYQALSAGLYQLIFLDRIPPSAAVNETVNAVREAGLPKQLQGFVNGVLRQFLRLRDDLPGPDTVGPDNRQLLNHPAWLTRRWQSHFGAEAMRKICAGNNLEPALCVRVTRQTSRPVLLRRFAESDIEAAPGNYSEEAILVTGQHGPVKELPGYHEGLFQVQDQAAQLATLLLGPFKPGMRYLDCCAGLGGKTTHLADLMVLPGAELIAVEPDTRRFQLLKENLHRLPGKGITSTVNETLETFVQTAPAHFDRVLLDAPCSGTGVIGRQPDIRWNRDESDLPHYRDQQKSLLDLASRVVRPGGSLVYATCSIEPEENIEVIRDFLTLNPGFTHTDCNPFLPEPAHELVVDNCFAPLPGPGIDGFFAARLTKLKNSD